MTSVVLRRILALLHLCLFAVGLLAHAAQPAETAAELHTDSGTLAGTLSLPPAPAPAPVPVALIIAGSGPTDRDGNSPLLAGRNDNLRQLAAALAQAGIASLRYDKRGLKGSAAAITSESALRFETYVDDAAAWIRQLQADPRFTAVAVIGHSEGSMIGMLAARRTNAAAFVSLAGLGRPPAEGLRRQLAGKLPPDLTAQNERIMTALLRGEQVADVPAPLKALWRPSVQPYVISWFRHDPAAAIAALDMPVLVVHGTTDFQVGVEDAHALKAANPKAQLAIIDGMNHVLKLAPNAQAAQMATYTDPSIALAGPMLDALNGFLRAVPALRAVAR